MPAQSQQQQKLFGLALSVKRGDTPRSEASEEVLKIVDSMTEKEIEDFAGTEHEGLPKKVEQKIREMARQTIRERMTEISLNESTVLDSKIDEFGELANEIDRVKAQLSKLTSKYKKIEKEIRPVLDELTEQGEAALTTQKYLITIKRRGYTSERFKYKEAFEESLTKVNAQTRRILEEVLQSTKSISTVASSIGVQSLQEVSLLKKLLQKIKGLFRKLFPMFKKNKNSLKKLQSLSKEILKQPVGESMNQQTMNEAKFRKGDMVRVVDNPKYVMDKKKFAGKSGYVKNIIGRDMQVTFPNGRTILVDPKDLEMNPNESVNEGKLDVGDVISVDGFVMLKGLDGGNRYKVIKQDGYSYTFQKVGSRKKVRHYKDDVDGWIGRRSYYNKIIKESVNEDAPQLWSQTIDMLDKNLKKGYDPSKIRNVNLIAGTLQKLFKGLPQRNAMDMATSYNDYKAGQKDKNQTVKDWVRILKKHQIKEASLSAIHKAAKKGSYPVTVMAIDKKKRKVVKQELVKTPMAVPAAFTMMQGRYPEASISVEDATGQVLFSESVNEAMVKIEVDMFKQFNQRRPDKTMPMKIDSKTPLSKLLNHTTFKAMKQKYDYIELHYGDKFLGSAQAGTDNWAFKKGRGLKDTSFRESINEGKNSASWTSPKTGKSYDIQKNGNRWEMDIMKKGSSIYDKVTTIKRKTPQELKDWLDGYKIDSKWMEHLLKSVNENATRTAMEIGGLTGLNKNVVQKFVDDNNLDIEKVFQFVKKGKLNDTMDFITAVVGKPNNPIQKKMVKMFRESVKIKMNALDWGKSTAERNANLDKYDLLKTDKEREAFLRKLKGESINEVNGEFVVYVEKDNGRKKLLHTKKSQRAANMFMSKNMDKILNKSGIRSIGSMSKDQWEKKEAQFAENIKKSDMKTVTKKEWDRTHKDFKGMIKGQPYMMWFDKQTQSTVYGPVQIKESVTNEGKGDFGGWVAIYKGKRLEIDKSEANGIYGAKQIAIKKLKVPKSKQSLLAIAPAVEESVNENKNVGHYERVGNQTIVDSNFVNFSKGVLPNSELVHLGMGDFALKTPKGDITFERSGKLVGIGADFVGRHHRMTDNKGGKLVDELIKSMVKKKRAILSMSESINETTEPQIITQLRDVVKNGYQKLEDPKTGRKVMVDSFSASAMVKLYDGLKNPNVRDKYVNSGLFGMQALAFKFVK